MLFLRSEMTPLPHFAEMEKRADAADTSVFFVSLDVLIFSCITRQMAKNLLCYQHCAKSNALKALCYNYNYSTVL